MAGLPNSEKRSKLLAQLFLLADRNEQLVMDLHRLEGEAGGISGRQKLEAQTEAINQATEKLLESYMKGLPLRYLSRCPFTNEVLSMYIDDMGIDGLWWNYDAPRRPESLLPATFYAIDGAMMLGGAPEKAPFLCSPGPDLPFVLPRLLEKANIKAVVSAIPIGPHAGYPVIYYADPMIEGEEKVNDWGGGYYWERGTLNPELISPGHYISLVSDQDEYDFDLGFWINKGKLMWITPGDHELALQSHTKGCPYLDLPGSRRIKFIQNGEVWEENEEEYETQEMNDPDFDLAYFHSIVERIERGEE